MHYERRLESPQISQDFRLLHPLVVTALERPDITRLYGLALAAGWLRNEGEQVILRLPGAGEQNLGLLAAGEAHPFVRALLRLTTSGPSEPSVVGQLRSALSNPTDEVRAAWQRFIQSYQPRATPAVQPPPVPVPTVQKCSNPKCGRDLKPGAKFCGNCKTPVPVVSPTPQPAPLPTSAGPAFANASQDMQDLAVVAALAAAQQLDPAGWGDLVMGQPRKLR